MTNRDGERSPADRAKDNAKLRIARDRPLPAGQTNSKKSYGPFGRGDREPDAKGKPPREDEAKS